MRKIALLTPAIALLLTACGFNPAEGQWQPSVGAVIEDGCGLGEVDAENQPETSTLTLTDDGFTFGEATCTLDGKDFSCLLSESTDLAEGTTLVIDYDNSGTFDGAEAATGTSEVMVSCTGDGCAAYTDALGLTLPCTSSYSYTIAYAGE